MIQSAMRSDCPKCDAVVNAHLEYEPAGAFLVKRCATHGESRTLFAKNADFHRRARELSNDGLWPEGPLDVFGDAATQMLTTFAIDVTTRCNMTCPTCVSNADTAKGSVDRPLEEILSWVPDFSHDRRRFRPNISLVGGESTLREDLPDIIRGVIAKGLVPRLNSNGLTLRNPELLDRLWDAGLRWVILQFDGFTGIGSREFRGKDHTRVKLDVVDKLAERGFFVHLAVMVQQGVNETEAADVLRYAMERPNVRRVSFYPRSRIGRFAAPDGGFTDVGDLVRELERGTAGELNADDLIDAKRIGHWMYRLTRHPMFFQRACIYPFMLLGHRGRMIPVSRLFRPSWAFRHPGALWTMIRALPALFRPDSGRYPANLLYVNIEKFYDRDAFDFEQSRNCHHVYLTDKGAFPFCVYNQFHREAAPVPVDFLRAPIEDDLPSAKSA